MSCCLLSQRTEVICALEKRLPIRTYTHLTMPLGSIPSIHLNTAKVKLPTFAHDNQRFFLWPGGKKKSHPHKIFDLLDIYRDRDKIKTFRLKNSLK